MRVSDYVVAFRVEPAEGWERERAEAGDTDLAAVGVAGEDEIDVLTALVGGDAVGEIGLVRHEDDGGVGVFGDGFGEVGAAVGEVVDAREYDALVCALNADVLVDEEGEAVVFHVGADRAGVDDGVMIAEDAVALWTGEGAKESGTAAGGGERYGEAEGAAGDEVAGDEHDVRIERVDLMDDVAEEEVFGVLLQMKV